MLGVVTFGHFSGGPQTAWEWSFVLIYGTILAWKVMPASFNLWRMILWSGRTVFRPRGTQKFQLITTSIGTLLWVSAVVAFSVRFAKPVIGFLESVGLSISV